MAHQSGRPVAGRMARSRRSGVPARTRCGRARPGRRAGDERRPLAGHDRLLDGVADGPGLRYRGDQPDPRLLHDLCQRPRRGARHPGRTSALRHPAGDRALADAVAAAEEHRRRALSLLPLAALPVPAARRCAVACPGLARCVRRQARRRSARESAPHRWPPLRRGQLGVPLGGKRGPVLEPARLHVLEPVLPRPLQARGRDRVTERFRLAARAVSEHPREVLLRQTRSAHRPDRRRRPALRDRADPQLHGRRSQLHPVADRRIECLAADALRAGRFQKRPSTEGAPLSPAAPRATARLSRRRRAPALRIEPARSGERPRRETRQPVHPRARAGGAEREPVSDPVQDRAADQRHGAGRAVHRRATAEARLLRRPHAVPAARGARAAEGRLHGAARARVRGAHRSVHLPPRRLAPRPGAPAARQHAQQRRDGVVAAAQRRPRRRLRLAREPPSREQSADAVHAGRSGAGCDLRRLSAAGERLDELRLHPRAVAQSRRRRGRTPQRLHVERLAS